MFNKERAVKINSIVLFCLGLVDLLRGFMHTYNINWAAVNIAKMEAHPDAMMLMGTFGISNFLTGFIYIYIAWKAKKHAPVLLFLIPAAYFIGVVGMKLSQVSMQSEFNGQYMMLGYMAICVISTVYYLISAKKDKKISE